MTRSGVILLLLMAVIPATHAGYIHGYVYTREVVTNDAGNFTWSEFNPANGNHVRDIGEAVGDLAIGQWRAMSGDEYRGIVAQKTELHEAQPDLELLSRADFEAANLVLADGTTTASKPPLGRATAWVSILPQARRLVDDAQGLVLAEYPINPDVAIGDDITSMLYKFDGPDMGQTKLYTSNRISLKTAFALNDNGEPVPIDDAQEITPGNEYTAAGPIRDAVLEGFIQTYAVTGSDGGFGMYSADPPCPGFSYSIDSLLLLTLNYQRFNPKANGRPGLYMDTYPTATVCTSSFYMVPLLGPFPTGWSTQNFPTHSIQFAIDLTVLSGTALLTDNIATSSNRVALSPTGIQVADSTRYRAEAPDYTDDARQILTTYDFDRDGLMDTIQQGRIEVDGDGNEVFVEGDPKQLQAVWLSSSGNVPAANPPDLTRVIDRDSFMDHSHQGLLEQISAEDLRNTDIYIVRVSDGKLISERIGLNEYNEDIISLFGEDADSGQFFYTIQMQGSTGDKRFYYNEFEEWQSTSGINPEFHQRESDLPQPGDLLRIFAINRATGYIGHTDVVLRGTNQVIGNDLTTVVEPIVMGPPNLRVRVERDYKIDKGATQSDEMITQLIGFEGASLTSDNTVSVITEWLDHEGRPLPASLEGAGYTGRIAILESNKTLQSGNDGVYQFAIEPGSRLQVLQLPNAITDSQHFYIHVSGEPKSGNPIFAGSTDNQRRGDGIDFSSSGQNPGILTKRPDNYVPFLVPVYDEVFSEMQSRAHSALRAANPNQAGDSPVPIYRWVYRPEMQFTSYDLSVDEINRSRDDDDDGTIAPDERIDILDSDTPLITADDMIDIVFGLTTTDLLPLDYFNAGVEKELVFVVGEQEVKATLGEDQIIQFEDLSHLDRLKADDFLTIRLYANNDMGNTLWQWAFMNLDVDVDSDNNNGLDLPDRSPEEEEVENLDTEPGKFLALNAGDTDDDGVPNFADFDPGERLVPMLVQIPDDIDIDSASIKFTYEQSDPANIDVDNSVDPPLYTPDEGFMRIWTVDGTEARNVASLSAGGHFVDSEQVIPLTSFELDDERVMVLYTELVRNKDEWSGLQAEVEIIE